MGVNRKRTKIVIKNKQFPSDFFNKSDNENQNCNYFESSDPALKENLRGNSEKMPRKVLRRVSSNFDNSHTQFETPKFNSNPFLNKNMSAGELTHLLRSSRKNGFSSQNNSGYMSSDSTNVSYFDKSDTSLANNGSPNYPSPSQQTIKDGSTTTTTAKKDIDQNLLHSYKPPRPFFRDMSKVVPLRTARPLKASSTSRLLNLSGAHNARVPCKSITDVNMREPVDESNSELESTVTPIIRSRRSSRTSTQVLTDLISQNQSNTSIGAEPPVQYSLEKVQSAPGSTIRTSVNQNLFSAWKMIEDFKRQYGIGAQETPSLDESSTRKAVVLEPLVEATQRTQRIFKKSQSNSVLSYEENRDHHRSATLVHRNHGSQSASKLPALRPKNAEIQPQSAHLKAFSAQKEFRINRYGSKIPFFENIKDDSPEKTKYSSQPAIDSTPRKEVRSAAVLTNKEYKNDDNFNVTFRSPVKEKLSARSYTQRDESVRIPSIKNSPSIRVAPLSKGEYNPHEFSFNCEINETPIETQRSRGEGLHEVLNFAKKTSSFMQMDPGFAHV